MKPLLFIVAVAAYLWSAFDPGPLVGWIISILSLLIVLTVFASVPRFVQGLGAVFLVIGLLLLVSSGASWTRYITGFGNMLNILSLFALIPLIALPIELGNYAQRIQRMIQLVRSSGPAFFIR
ncbi:hypothetical protein ACHHV8_28320 [Paenibacillus sp. TAB 01]|uniref:hypothetical protein n=1 Tax=Paenibacillus sp. TAB 01 TaxID=3368988 RepID=UPI003752DCDE